MTKTKARKTLGDCQADAVILYGLAQAADELDFASNADNRRNSPASNALTSVNHVLKERAGQLADDLDALTAE